MSTMKRKNLKLGLLSTTLRVLLLLHILTTEVTGAGVKLRKRERPRETERESERGRERERSK